MSPEEEKEFDEKFNIPEKDGVVYENHHDVKAFITTLLQARDKELVEAVEGMKRGSPYLNGDFTYKNSEAHHYNQALDDILALIKKRGEQLLQGKE